MSQHDLVVPLSDCELERLPVSRWMLRNVLEVGGRGKGFELGCMVSRSRLQSMVDVQEGLTVGQIRWLVRLLEDAVVGAAWEDRAGTLEIDILRRLRAFLPPSLD